VQKSYNCEMENKQRKTNQHFSKHATQESERNLYLQGMVMLCMTLTLWTNRAYHE